MIFGWQEWVALPKLGLPAVLAKVDTGATISALDVTNTEPFTRDGKKFVRFTVRPLTDHPNFLIQATAPLVGEHSFKSSNGQQEMRLVIATNISVGGKSWPLEISLAERENMAYRMLLGRQALEDANINIDPASTCLQPTLSASDYRQLKP